jgi:hypothetical protein
MPKFAPGPYEGEQRRNPEPRPVEKIQAEVAEMLAHFRKAIERAKK